MSIILTRDLLRWNWSIEDDDSECLQFGWSHDYTTATVAALMAFDALRQERGT